MSALDELIAKHFGKFPLWEIGDEFTCDYEEFAAAAHAFVLEQQAHSCLGVTIRAVPTGDLTPAEIIERVRIAVGEGVMLEGYPNG